MRSERRLHPATLLFDVAKHLRNFALPALLVFFGASQSSGGPGGRFGRVPAGWEAWLLVLVVPAILASVARYVSFRLRYDDDELVIRSGLLFRNERHIPFSRIQNIDAVQNVVHRVLDVVEVRVETGGGKGEEARLSVLPRAAFDEMRRRVIEGRTAAGHQVAGPPKPDTTDGAGETLVHLALRELLLCGFLENRGLVLIGAAYGALWQAGIFESLAERLVGGAQIYSRGFLRDLVTGIAGGGPLPLTSLALAAIGLAGLLVIVRLVSMIWAFVRLYDFRLRLIDSDLRTTFGLFTRVAATIPIHRVQTITIRQGPLHLWLNRAAVTVETAGRRSESGARDREWLAPLVRQQALAALVGRIVPAFDLDAVSWRRAHPRALRRALKPRIGLVAAAIIASVALIGWGGLVLTIPIGVWVIVDAWVYVAALGWAQSADVVLMRSGRLWRRVTIARVNKIQAVALRESPFDRRAAMARVRVDTAGAGQSSHRVDIPYLDREVAGRLADRLATQAASTEFKW